MYDQSVLQTAAVPSSGALELLGPITRATSRVFAASVNSSHRELVKAFGTAHDNVMSKRTTQEQAKPGHKGKFPPEQVPLLKTTRSLETE